MWFIGGPGEPDGSGAPGRLLIPAGRNEYTRWWPNNHFGAWTHPRVYRWRASNLGVCWQATHSPPIGGSDCTLSFKLAFQAWKDVPLLCMLTMGGSDACDRGSEELWPSAPGSIGPNRLLEPKVGVKSHSEIDSQWQPGVRCTAGVLVEVVEGFQLEGEADLVT